MQTDLSRFWTRFAYDDNHYITGALGVDMPLNKTQTRASEYPL